MTSPPTLKPKSDKLFWIKYNPTEWLGMYPELTDEEYGFLHRIIAKLWSIPGNRLSEADLLTDLRVKPGSRRAKMLQGLIGYALKVSPDGLLFVPAIDDAFTDAQKRGSAGTVGARARWNKPEHSVGAVPPSTPTDNPIDF